LSSDSKLLAEIYPTFQPLVIEIELNFKEEYLSTSGWIYDLTGQREWASLLWSSECQAMKPLLNPTTTLFLQALLNLYLRCLQWAKLPIFDLPIIEKFELVNNLDDRYSLGLKISSLSHIHPQVDEIAFLCAQKIIQYINRFPPNLDSRRKLHRYIDESVLPSLEKYLTVGKSTFPVMQVAHEMGIPFQHLGLGVYQLGWGSRSRRLLRSVSDSDSLIGQILSGNKVVCAQVLSLYGLPVPTHQIIASVEDVTKHHQEIGFPAVVKPLNGARGEGVFVDLINLQQLHAAYKKSALVAKNSKVLLEKQVEGVCHRIFICNEEMLYAVLRGPMAVIGDGKHTIAELIMYEQARQLELPYQQGVTIPSLDEEAIQALMKQAYLPSDIPLQGISIELRLIESTEWGGIDVDVTGSIHPANVEIACLAAQAMGINMAGVDMISKDISVPWYMNGAVINEVNFSPLLGGAQISRSYLRQFFGRFIQGDGKIPIEEYSDSELARQRHHELNKKNVRCFLLNQTHTLDASSQLYPMIHQDLLSRLRALIYRTDIDALVIDVSEQHS